MNAVDPSPLADRIMYEFSEGEVQFEISGTCIAGVDRDLGKAYICPWNLEYLVKYSEHWNIAQ